VYGYDHDADYNGHNDYDGDDYDDGDDYEYHNLNSTRAQ
jgi:hypothetical protein